VFKVKNEKKPRSGSVLNMSNQTKRNKALQKRLANEFRAELEAMARGEGTSLAPVPKAKRNNTMNNILKRLPATTTKSKALQNRLTRKRASPGKGSYNNNLASIFSNNGRPARPQEINWSGLAETQNNTLRKIREKQALQDMWPLEELQKRPQTLYTKDPFTSEFNFFYKNAEDLKAAPLVKSNPLNNLNWRPTNSTYLPHGRST